MPKNNFHKEILTEEQIDLLSLLRLFNKDFGMVGGSAIALLIGHRESIDFDLFSLKEFSNNKIRRKILNLKKISNVVRDETGQYTIIINGVRFTFFHYPFEIIFSENFNDIIKIPNLLTLGAMKAYALGRRPKWKDYVDLYFIIKRFYSVKEISKKADEIFKGEFNEKNFRNQLSYFDDINYKEPIVYKKGFEIDDEIIKRELTEFSLLL